ncbi:hypothetical protein ABZP36_017335 [Zizania latifolia]
MSVKGSRGFVSGAVGLLAGEEKDDRQRRRRGQSRGGGQRKRSARRPVSAVLTSTRLRSSERPTSQQGAGLLGGGALERDAHSQELQEKKRNERIFYKLLIDNVEDLLSMVYTLTCLPITFDVGTNNETLLNDKFYIRLKQHRATGKEYHELLEEFMTAVKQNYGEKVLI